jgi:inhibitor of KinA sporulation pathway (predicted exonuclease)
MKERFKLSKKQKYSDNCILVIDVESTCDENKDGKPKETIISEIIEVGYAVLDYNLNEIKEKGSIVVKPCQSVITPFCTSLTGWTQEAVDRGISWAEACKTLEEDLISGGRLWASYGNYDREMFVKMCQMYNVKYPMIPQHLNIKAISTVMLGGVYGLAGCLHKLKMNFEGRHHLGSDDAYNAARILQYYKAKFGDRILI